METSGIGLEKLAIVKIDRFQSENFYLFVDLDATSDVETLTRRLTQHDMFRTENTEIIYHVGFHVSIKTTALQTHITNWLNQDSRLNLFYYIHLPPHVHISDKIQKYHMEDSKIIHILPDEDLHYGRFKEELWDLHLAGYQVYFHHVDRVKSFSKDLHYFQRLSNRGVQIGINPLWQVSWLSKDVTKIKKLIDDLSIHFFNTQNIDLSSDGFAKETLKKEQILDGFIQ